MRPDIWRFSVGRIIVHEIPKKTDLAARLRLSDIDSETDEALREYFRTKIVDSLREAGTDVNFNPDSKSPCPVLVSELLQPETDAFVAHSKSMATHLYELQNGVHSAGIMVLVEGAIDEWPALAILKLEMDRALQLREASKNGQMTFDLIQAKRLVMSEKTRVFKAGLFVLDDSGSIQGLVSDLQKGSTTAKGMANFFLATFLGCKYSSNPQVITKEVFEVIENTIRNTVESEENRFRYATALIAEMNRNADSFDVYRFASDHLMGDDQTKVINAIRDANLPRSAFPKDTALIEPDLKQAHILFGSGMKLKGSPAVIKERVLLQEDDEGETQVLILDWIREFRPG